MFKSSRVKWLWALLFGLIVITLLTIKLWQQQPSLPPLPEWHAYKSIFLSTEGRIVDSGNHGVSHSESQGYGMLFAFHASDHESFQLIWQWTQKNLQIRNDHLFAWRLHPSEGISDINNASDGDILIAWALLKAGEAWSEESYLQDGQKILDDLQRSVIRQWQGQTILLPGEYGFEHDGVYTVNLSYWLFPAFRDFQRIYPSPDWQALEQSGRYLIAHARFGEWQLPPDWLQLGETPQLATTHKPRYGYDAIRVPLNLVWAEIDDPVLLKPFSHFHKSIIQLGSHLPSWVDLANNQLGEYDAPAGMKAVYNLLENTPRSEHLTTPSMNDDYYSSSLMIMAKLASN